MLIQAYYRLCKKQAALTPYRNGFQDRFTGFHTNDVESGGARFKAWSRQRYGMLQLEHLDLREYAFYVNVWNSFNDVLRALAEISLSPCEGWFMLTCQLIRLHPKVKNLGLGARGQNVHERFDE